MREFFRILRILDWNQYAKGQAEAMAKAEQG